MIYCYGITQQGTYHIKNNTVCQDAHNIIKCGDSFAIAAVADGLGSEKHSDIASRIAADVSTEYCKNKICEDYSDDQILEVIRESFSNAQSIIEHTASENGHEFDQYDTTLSLVVFKDGMLYYGQSGDSGIVALTSDGLYNKVVDQQRDEEGRVYPLYFGDDKWVFGKYPEPVVSVFLATDGMLEILFPVYIRNEPVSIYVALARYFMGPDSLRIEEVGEEYVRNKIEDFMKNIPDEQVNDDKTVVVLVDPDIEMELQSEEYYAEPDWNVLRRKYEEDWKRAAYPQLFNDCDEAEIAGPIYSDDKDESSDYSVGKGVILDMKAAFELFFEKLVKLYEIKFGTNPTVTYSEKLDKTMLVGEPDEDYEIQWVPKLQSEKYDWGATEKSLGFSLCSELKDYYNTYWFLSLSGTFGNCELHFYKIDGSESLGDIAVRNHQDAECIFPNSECFLIGNAVIDGNDYYYIYFDNSDGGLFCYDSELKNKVLLSYSLAKTIGHMEAGL